MSDELQDILESTTNSAGCQPRPAPENGRISEEIARANGIRSRHAWNKNGRAVQSDAVAKYIVEPCKWLPDGRRSPRGSYTGFTVEQTVPKPKRKPKNKLPITVPDGLPLKRMRQEFGDDLDRVLWLLGTICLRRLFDRRCRDDDAYVRLYSPVLQRIMGKQYRCLINRLNGWIIEVDENYDWQREHYSKGYRFTEKYADRGLRQSTISDPRVIDKITEPRPTSRIDRHLWKFLTKVRIDEAKASIVTKGWLQDQMLTQIRDCRWRYEVDDFGRRHTNLTNLWKEGRKCLTYQDQPLVGWDIRNSQPLFLALAAMEWCKHNYTYNTFSKEPGVLHIYPYVARDVEILLENTVVSLASKSAQSVINGIPDDLRQFIGLCEQGVIYEYFMNAVGLTNRSTTKDIVFGVIYGKSNYQNVRVWRSVGDHEFFVVHPSNEKERRNNVLPLRKLVYEVFVNHFPTVTAFMADMKGEGDKHYKNLSHRMQASESKLIFGGCCRDLMDRHADVPIFTIHDSVITVPGCEGLVRAVLLDNFARLGVKPTLNREEYGAAE